MWESTGTGPRQSPHQAGRERSWLEVVRWVPSQGTERNQPMNAYTGGPLTDASLSLPQINTLKREKFHIRLSATYTWLMLLNEMTPSGVSSFIILRSSKTQQKTAKIKARISTRQKCKWASK